MTLRLVTLAVVLGWAGAASAEDFTIVVVPDTQTYAADPALTPVLGRMVDHILANKDAQNIDLVLHVGDLVDAGSQDLATATTATQWQRFNSEWKRLDGQVAYAIVRGNHDNTAEFAQHYGEAHFGQLDGGGQPLFPHYLATHQGEGGDASAWVANLGGNDALVLGISCSPTNAEIAWAQGLLDTHPDLPAIVLSHIVTARFGLHPFSRTSHPACAGGPNLSIWNTLVAPNAPQVFMTASGHFLSEHGYKALRGVGEEVSCSTPSRTSRSRRR